MNQVSATAQIYLSHAANEARKSTLLSQHGCVAVANGKIMARGHNTTRTQSQDGFICNTCSCHAEIAALRGRYIAEMLAVAAAVGAAHQLFASVSVKDVIVTCWVIAMLVLSSVMSPPPPVAVMLPWMPQTVPPLS